jgi:UDP:flavonoid glycosyltransferase YjiC (YdhE family)
VLIAVMASGTRGDVQPMIALGQGLQAAGHRVRLIAGSNFVPWVESYGLECYPTVDMEALMRSERGIAWVESRSQIKQLQTMKALMGSIDERSIQDTIDGTQGAELLIGGFIAEPYLQAISERHSTPQISVALQPYRATSLGAASLVPILPRANSLLNRWMGRFTERMSWSIWQPSVNRLRARLGLAAHSARSYLQAAHGIPALYAISAHVVPPLDDQHTHTTGYWFLDEPETPSAGLLDFLDRGDPPVYLGFGSMSSSDPAATVRMMVSALAEVGRRGVLARGWSNAAVGDLPAHVYGLDKAAHSWLFPRMAAVVHHGGAGTTAAGLRAGRPTLVVPHMSDQPFWGRRVHELGVGPKPLPRARITAATLAERLHTLVADQQLSGKAAALGAQIRAEPGLEQALAWIERFIAGS